MKPMFLVHRYVEIGPQAAKRMYVAGETIDASDVESWEMSPEEVKTQLTAYLAKGYIEALPTDPPPSVVAAPVAAPAPPPSRASSGADEPGE